MSFILKNHILCEITIVALIFFCYFVFSKNNLSDEINNHSKDIMLETKKMLSSI